MAARPVVLGNRLQRSPMTSISATGDPITRMIERVVPRQIPNIDFHENPMWRYYEMSNEQRDEAGITGLATALPDDMGTANRDIGAYQSGLMRFGAKHNDIYPILADMIRWAAGLPSRRDTGPVIEILEGAGSLLCCSAMPIHRRRGPSGLRKPSHDSGRRKYPWSMAFWWPWLKPPRPSPVGAARTSRGKQRDSLRVNVDSIPDQIRAGARNVYQRPDYLCGFCEHSLLRICKAGVFRQPSGLARAPSGPTARAALRPIASAGLPNIQPIPATTRRP